MPGGDLGVSADCPLLNSTGKRRRPLVAPSLPYAVKGGYMHAGRIERSSPPGVSRSKAGRQDTRLPWGATP